MGLFLVQLSNLRTLIYIFARERKLENRSSSLLSNNKEE